MATSGRKTLGAVSRGIGFRMTSLKLLVITVWLILYPLFIAWCVVSMLIEAWNEARYVRGLKVAV